MGWGGPVTHRQHLAFLAWLEYEFDMPSRSDYYLMGIMCEVRRVLHRRPDKVKLNQFRLRFNEKTADAKADGPEQVDLSKGRWMMLMTTPVVYKTLRLEDRRETQDGGPNQ